MPTAELLKPATLTAYGRVWRRGEIEPISNELAAELVGNPRFRVQGYMGQAAAEAVPSRLTGDKLYEAIRIAVDDLNPDDEEAFTATGMPNVHAISASLGFPVTREEIEAAMRQGTEDSEATQLDLLDEPKKPRGGVRIKRAAKAQDEGQSGEGGENQPPAGKPEAGTENAIEV